MKPNILIVDDEAPIRMLLQAFFRRRGYEVSVAATAKETLGVLDEVPIQVIILDIALEDADGLELLAVIKQAHPELPVIMLTGMGFDEELENEARSKGAAGYASKTLPLDELLLQVRRVLKPGNGENQAACKGAEN